MYDTRFFREYKRPESLSQIHNDFYDICSELRNVGHEQKTGIFTKNNNSECADSSYLLANSIPLTVARLRAVKWTKSSGSESLGEISLWVAHSNPDQKFPELEDIANYYKLVNQGITNDFANRRLPSKK